MLASQEITQFEYLNVMNYIVQIPDVNHTTKLATLRYSNHQVKKKENTEKFVHYTKHTTKINIGKKNNKCCKHYV